MYRGTLILNEKDPFLREIWAMGWDKVIEHHLSMTITLVNDTTGENKVISISDLHPWSFKLKKGILPNGEIHYWISEADCSAERFRSVIKSDWRKTCL